MRRLQRQEDVRRPHHRQGDAGAQQGVGTRGAGGVQIGRHHIEDPLLLTGVRSHVQHAALNTRFYAQHRLAQAGENGIAIEKVLVVITGSRRVGADQHAHLHHVPVELAIVGVVLKGHIHTTGQQCSHRTTRTHGGDQRRFVAAGGHAGEHKRSLGGQIIGKVLRHGPTIGGAAAGSCHSDDALCLQIQPLTPEIEDHRRQVDFPQALRVELIIPGGQIEPQLLAAAQDALCALCGLIAQALHVVLQQAGNLFEFRALRQIDPFHGAEVPPGGPGRSRHAAQGQPDPEFCHGKHSITTTFCIISKKPTIINQFSRDSAPTAPLWQPWRRSGFRSRTPWG